MAPLQTDSLRRLPAAALPLVAAISLSGAPSAPPVMVDVYVAGEGGYHTYRIPSVIATPKGTLLAFAEGRKAGAADAGDIDLILKRSSDGGDTWSAAQVVGDDGPNTFGNPCPVVDLKTGVIWLLSTHNRGTDRESDIIAGTSAASRTVWIMKSEDDGATWSPPVEITASVKKPDWTWYATGPGVGIQTRSGRLVIPANHAEAGTRIHRSHLIFSDDGGRTWTRGGVSDEGTNESQVVELADGRLMLNMRNHPPRPQNFRMVATSDDGGRTLSRALPDPALVEPPAQASLLRLARAGSQDRDRLVFANPASTRRERMTVRVSEDGGASWPLARVVHESHAAYSSLVALPDSGVGLLFERGERSAYEKISFARLTLDWLTDAGAARVAGTADLPHPAAGAASPAPAAGSHILIVSGDDGTRSVAAKHQGFPTRILRYDTARRDWEEAGALPASGPVTLPAVPWRDGFILVSGEIRPGVRTPHLLVLHPAR